MKSFFIIFKNFFCFFLIFFISCSVCGNEDKKLESFINFNEYKNEIKVSKQLITVSPYSTSYATVRLWEKSDLNVWHEVVKMNGRVGEKGISKHKREGDKKTPSGIYNLKEGFGSKKILTKITYKVLDGSEYWVDDYNSKFYNTMQIGLKKGSWNSSEHLIDNKVEYQYAVIIDYNRYPVVSKKGSAIFLHVENNKSTSGCIAVSKKNMIKILRWLDPKKTPKIIIIM